jgi:hypothetical protein
MPQKNRLNAQHSTDLLTFLVIQFPIPSFRYQVSNIQLYTRPRSIWAISLGFCDISKATSSVILPAS